MMIPLFNIVRHLLFLFIVQNDNSCRRSHNGYNTNNNHDLIKLHMIQENSRSPWSSSEWTITLNIGRELNTLMPTEWGASGSRLVLPLEVLIESDYYDGKKGNDDNNNKSKKDSMIDNEDYLGLKSFQLSILEDPTYINMNGQQTVPFHEYGAWKITSPRPTTTSTTSVIGEASKIRFWLDVNTNNENNNNNNNNNEQPNVAAIRNDVILYSERLYFISNCWRINESYYIGLQRYQQCKDKLEQIQLIIDNCLMHDSGDRRLDGSNVIETISGSIDMIKLVQQRDDAKRELIRFKQILPTTAAKQSSSTKEGSLLSTTTSTTATTTATTKAPSTAGFWPGHDDLFIINEGTIAVKRNNNLSSKGILSKLLNEYHIIGTFTAKPSDKWETIEE